MTEEMVPEELIQGRYCRLTLIGRGTYGKVYKALDTHTNQHVAVKEIQVAQDELQEGVHSTTLREMSILSKMKGHPHIIEYVQKKCRLKQVIFESLTKTYLIMEFAEIDLKTLISRRPLNELECRVFLYQILRALEHLHRNFIFHRDIKPCNILILDQQIKLGDFGLAKQVGQPSHRSHTREVQTLWYRAPELLLGNLKYTPQIDIFSLGCVFYEMMTRQPLFPSSSEIEQLFKLFQLMGTPMNWKAYPQMPFYKISFPRFKADFAQRMVFLPAVQRNLLENMLQIDPLARISATDALKHPYFQQF